MADEAQVEILKRGRDVWNKWRDANPQVIPNLQGANLRGENLRGTDLTFVDLTRAELDGADISYADLSRAELSDAQIRWAKLHNTKFKKAVLTGACLEGADLSLADLDQANLGSAMLAATDLSHTNLYAANLSQAILSEATLKGAALIYTDFRGAILREADLSRAVFRSAVLSEIDLSSVIGLESVIHEGPSSICSDSFRLSKGLIPEAFLRGCGLSDWEIEIAKLYRPDMSNEGLTDALYRIHEFRAQQPIQVSPLFISYSHADSDFVDQLERRFVKAGIRFWRDVHHATAGRLERQIDRAIRLNPTVLLILSEHSVESDWVEHEARLARKLEKEMGRDVMCPVALDGSWKDCPWPERLREQIMEYNILDFSRWQDGASFDRMYRRLLEGLNLFYREN